MPSCRTPGARYDIDITPRFVRIAVALPANLELKLTESEAIAIENHLHDALERVLTPYLPEVPVLYGLIWKGKGPMPHLAVGTVASKTDNSYNVQLTREEMAWLADDWTFNDCWGVINYSEWHT
jgi:hypothetical protein